MLRRTLTCLAAAALAAVGLTLGTAGPASAAIGDETLQCEVLGSGTGYQENCYNAVGGNEYYIDFVLFGADPGSTYLWTVSRGTPVNGCSASTNYCLIRTGRGGGDRVVTVAYSDGVQSATRTTTAYIEPWCGTGWC